MAMPTTWTVEIEFTEDEEKTRADADTGCDTIKIPVAMTTTFF